jgi:hypothetical protein
MRATTTMTTPRGWRLVSIESLRVRLKPTLTPHGRGPLRGRRAVPATVSKRSPHRAVPVPTPLLCPCRARQFLSGNPLPRPERATVSRLW